MNFKNILKLKIFGFVLLAVIIFLWIFHLFTYLKYDKFAFSTDMVPYTDEGYWNYPARHKYIYGTWWDSSCHYNFRFYVTPIYQLTQYLSFKTFGLNELGLRFPAFLFFVLTVLMLLFYLLKYHSALPLEALFILSPFFFERFFLTRMTTAILESELIFILTASYILYMVYLRNHSQKLFLPSIVLVILAYFVKPYAILMGIPLIIFSNHSLKHKIGYFFLLFSIPILWNLYVLISNKTAFYSIKYDLYSIPRIWNVKKLLTGKNIINPSYIFTLPAFWFVIYFLMLKTPIKEIYTQRFLQFDLAVIFYLSAVFLFYNRVRYSFPLIPIFADMSIYMLKKRFTLKKNAFYFIILTFALTFFQYSIFILLSNITLILVSLWVLNLIFIYCTKKIGFSWREALFPALLTGALLGNIHIHTEAPSFHLIVYILYIIIANLFVVLLNPVPYSRKTGLNYPLLLIALYVFVFPVWINNEISYFRGKNNFRQVVTSCVKNLHIKYDCISGRGADNFMLFTRIQTIGTFSPDYVLYTNTQPSVFIKQKSCFTNKKMLVFGYPIKDGSEQDNNVYMKEFQHSLPAQPLGTLHIGDCSFIYDTDTTNRKAQFKIPVYIFQF